MSLEAQLSTEVKSVTCGCFGRMMIKYIAIEFVQARQIGLKANTILGTKWVDGTVRESSSDDPTQVTDWAARSARV